MRWRKKVGVKGKKASEPDIIEKMQTEPAVIDEMQTKPTAREEMQTEPAVIEKRRSEPAVRKKKQGEPDFTFKICLIGEGGVGKTCIARQLCYNSFSLATKLTVGIDFYSYQFPVIVDGKENIVGLSIWDFGGQEQFRILFGSYINGVNGIFLVFDLLRMESLMKLDWWLEKLEEYNLKSIPKILIGNKLDLAQLEDDQLKVDSLVVEQFLQRHDEKDYLQTSAKDSTNISLVFKELTKKIFDLHDFGYEKIV